MSRSATRPTPIIGLTGNIASGKSTVAALLAAHGAAIIDADQLARDAVAPGTPALAAIAAQWPTAIRADGTLDRPALRRIIFDDPIARRAVESITHPAIGAARDVAIAAAISGGAPILVYDVPLLFEAGLTDTVDAIILVDAPEAVRRARLIRDRGYTAADADAAIRAQMPAAAKRAGADIVIENDGSTAALAAQVAAVWPTLARVAPRD